jgi:AAA lid domain
LLQVLDWKLKDQDLSATDGAKTVAIEILGRSRNRPNFGNAGEVENLLRKAKENYLKRQSSLPKFQRPLDTVFEPQDFDPEFNRGEQATNNLEKLFEDVVGCEEIVEKLKGYQQVARNAKARKFDAGDFIPTTFVFKGPPGENSVLSLSKV